VAKCSEERRKFLMNVKNEFLKIWDINIPDNDPLWAINVELSNELEKCMKRKKRK
jgi:hypothetical protein